MKAHIARNQNAGVPLALGWNLSAADRGILEGMAPAFGMKLLLVSPADAGKTVAQLLGEVETKAARTLVLEPGAYPPALVLANFKEKDVDTLLDLMKQAKVNIPLKAIVTPSNKNWVFFIGLHECRIGPMTVFLLAGSRHRIEILVRNVVLLHPAPGPFGDTIRCPLVLDRIVFQACQLIAENYTVVVQTEPDSKFTAQRVGKGIKILGSLVAAIPFFARQHRIGFGNPLWSGYGFQPQAVPLQGIAVHSHL